MPDFLNEEQVVVLKHAHRTIRDKKLADRIKAVLSLNRGMDYAELAAVLLLDEATLHRYVKQFRDKGLDGLLECRYSGGQTRLSAIQEAKLKLFLKENTPRTALAVAKH